MSEAEVSQFLCVLIKMGEALQNSGAEVFRVEDTLNRIAAAYGAEEVNIFVITSSIVVTLTMPDLPPQTQTRRLRKSTGNDLLELEQLNALSRHICAEKPPVAEFQQQLSTILAQPGEPRLHLAGSVLGAASFAVFFGGSLWDGVLAGGVAVFICWMERWLAPFCLNGVAFQFIASFLSGMAALLCCRVCPLLHADMVLIGFLAFLDPPKETTRDAIHALREYGVGVKILTGDNEKVTCAICRQVGMNAERVLLGADIDAMDDETLAQAADVGISVDTAVDIAKESASVVLLEKDLMVLEKGVIEGRKIYANMMKYIKMTAASNFGNMFSVLAASAFLPFLPMASLHLILLNLIYDISCTAIPWDNVDAEYLKVPRTWDASGISRFMLWMGPVSSLFDIATYLLLYFVIAPMACGGMTFAQLTNPAMQDKFAALFQTGWFIESMWTQTLVMHMIRTKKLPFIQSHASLPVMLLTMLGIAVVTLLPFTPLAAPLGLCALPPVYFAYLALIVLGYMVLATLMKKLYIRKYHELL